MLTSPRQLGVNRVFALQVAPLLYSFSKELEVPSAKACRLKYQASGPDRDELTRIENTRRPRNVARTCLFSVNKLKILGEFH